MTTQDADPCVDAIRAWQAAEQAYSDESRPYWSPVNAMQWQEKTLDDQALTTLSSLREAADVARRRYFQACHGVTSA